jgi:hypothetical protein
VLWLVRGKTSMNAICICFWYTFYSTLVKSSLHYNRGAETHTFNICSGERERFSSNDGLFPWEDDEQLILYFSAIVFLAFGGKSTLEKMPFPCFI